MFQSKLTSSEFQTFYEIYVPSYLVVGKNV